MPDVSLLQRVADEGLTELKAELLTVRNLPQWLFFTRNN